MCVKFKAKQPWSGPFDKDRQWTTEETWKIIVSPRSWHKLHDITRFLFRQCWLHTFLVSAMFQPTFSKPLNNSSLISRYFCSCVLFLLSFLLVTSHLSKNWSRVDVQGVPNYFSTSGRLGNDDDDDDDFLIVITTLRLCEPCASATRRTRNGTFFLAPWTSRQELFCTYN